MNKRKVPITNDYRQLRRKIILQTFFMVFGAVILAYEFYIFIAKGRFGDFVVAVLNRFVFPDYETSYQVYQHVFRNYRERWFFAAVLILFFILLRAWLKGFIKYFKEINYGIDALIAENAGDVVLSPELAVTERKINSIKHTLAQRKLAAEVAEQRKNDLVVYLAHDLKTPLTSVIGYLTLLRDEDQISDELREKYLSISLDKAERLEDLINEFFEITRFNLSNLTLEYSRVNLSRLLEQLTFEFKPMLSEKNVSCELNIAPDTMICCDVDKMQRVFDNLLRNAVNYSFRDDTIRIVVQTEAEEIRIRFLNHGNTIPEEKLERIFEQFYRLDTSRSSGSGGAGLGLAIAREIVELHRGTITAKSENEEIEFEVALPLS